MVSVITQIDGSQVQLFEGRAVAKKDHAARNVVNGRRGGGW